MPRLQGRIDLDGAILNVGIEVGEAKEVALRSRGLSVPPAFQTTALIDTGASRTALHPMVIQALGLTPSGYTPLSTPGHAIQNVRLYDARVSLSSSAPLFPIEAAAVAPATSSVLVLIGRDILERCSFFFDGQNKSFSLWF